MAKAKETAKKEESDFQVKLRSFLREQLKGVKEDELQDVLKGLQKETTKEMKTVKSSIVNTKYQPYVDSLLEAKTAINKIFQDTDAIIAIVGQNRVPIEAKLVGYNSSTGDIWVEYMFNKELVVKNVKANSVVDDIGKIPVPKATRAKKK